MKKIATASAIVVFAFVALPTKAQISFLALGAFDVDWEGLALGAGIEYPVGLEIGPVGNTAVRPSAEYVFAGGGNAGGAGNYSVFRISGELVGNLNLGGDSAFRSSGQPGDSQFEPFVKAGLALERFSFKYDSDVPFIGGTSFSNSEIGLVIGGGANIQKFFVEGTVGIGNISVLRIGGGYKFGGGGE
ncbi:MAG: hypothetical protein HKN43_05685 [Rhodothermales bacterium]|nr:hypothetical protein [Rhodothermales bacterium]